MLKSIGDGEHMSFLRKTHSDIEITWNDGAESRSVPLVLAGPILRRTEPNRVTVWIALKKEQTVRLSIINKAGNEVLTGSAKTVPLGEFLHVVAVTATQGRKLQREMVYQYDLGFEPEGKKLASPEILTKSGGAEPVAYREFDRPSFSLPPTDLDDLRLVHASCRKPHAAGRDSLLAVHRMLMGSAPNADDRPHQLFLTGDQIYADDVADALVAVLTDVGNTLLDDEFEETLPFGPGTSSNPSPVSEHKPGDRQKTANRQCGFSAGFAKSHLFGLGEYYAMYLLAWSPTLWPPIDHLPEFSDIYGQLEENLMDISARAPGGGGGEAMMIAHFDLDQRRVGFKKERDNLSEFYKDLGTVRKVLANVPTYMIFDDHEITDDWYLSGKWTKRVISSRGGKRILENGLLAYAIFQSWGNTPNRFEARSGSARPVGRHLLDAASVTEGIVDINRDWLDIFLGIPRLEGESLTWPRDQDPITTLDFHYSVTEPNHEVVVLDTRTWRGFDPRDDNAPPKLITSTGMNRQLSEGGSVEVTFIVSAIPLWIHPSIAGMKKYFSRGGPFVGRIRGERGKPSAQEAMDFEDWDLQQEAFERLLARLATRKQSSSGPTSVVVLSGDVHTGFGVKTQYWAKHPFEQRIPTPTRATIVNLTASAAKNEDKDTRQIGREGYGFWKSLAKNSTPELHSDDIDVAPWKLPKYAMAGWHNPLRDLLDDLVDFWPGPRTLRDRPATLFLKKSNSIQWAGSQPEWLYRIDYLDAVPNMSGRLSDPKVNTALTTANASRVIDIQEHFINQRVVGQNNLGEVTVDTDQNTVTQDLWWWVTPTSDLTGLVPLTRYQCSLDITDDPPQVAENYPEANP